MADSDPSIRVTGTRREHLDTAALARLLADLASQPEDDDPESHPTIVQSRDPRDSKRERP